MFETSAERLERTLRRLPVRQVPESGQGAQRVPGWDGDIVRAAGAIGCAHAVSLAKPAAAGLSFHRRMLVAPVSDVLHARPLGRLYKDVVDSKRGLQDAIAAPLHRSDRSASPGPHPFC
jgi:hypothetical protein